MTPCSVHPKRTAVVLKRDDSLTTRMTPVSWSDCSVIGSKGKCLSSYGKRRELMYATKKGLVCLLGAFLVGCTTMRIPSKHLCSQDFLRLYNHPGTLGDYWEYKGLKNGRH